MCAATKVTMPSSRATLIDSSTKNVDATGAGSAIPVVSMMIAERQLPARTRAQSRFVNSTSPAHRARCSR